MALIIELTPEQEAHLAAVAQQEGLAPNELARKFVIEHLPARLPQNETTVSAQTPVMKRDPELVERVKSIRGKYAQVGVTTDDLHRERRADEEHEKRQLQGLGMFAHVPGGSEAFAREKQTEIEREDRPRS